MITEVDTTVYAIRVNGQLIASNIPSRQLAESAVFNLPPDQRAVAEIVPMAQNGLSLLLG